METVGLIPCAGKGSRLGLPFSKEMFPDVHSDSYRPIIVHTIEAMKLAGINHIIFTINPNKTDLLRFLGNGRQFDLSFSYCIHPEPKSLAESVDEAYHLTRDRRVVFAMPDTVIRPKTFVQELLAAHEADYGRSMTFGCFKASNPRKFGMVEFEGDRVVKIVDKPAITDLTWMWGSIVWDPVFGEELRQFTRRIVAETKEAALTDALENLLQERSVGLHRFFDGTYRDLGTYDEIIDWSAGKGKA